MKNISELNKTELKELLKKVKLLNSLKKSLGNRGLREFNRINNGINFYKVEYFNSNYEDLSFIKNSAIEAFNTKFGLTLDVNQIIFTENKNLKGGFRIFYNDNMCDFGYSRIEKLLK